MARPTALEIQDALYGDALRTVDWAAAFLALAAFVLPTELSADGVAWIWDAWAGSEAFFLVPLAAGVVLAGLGLLEAVPGLALAGAASAAAFGWWAAAPEPLAAPFAGLAAGSDDRLLLARIAVPLLLAGLAARRVLHRSLAARALVGLGVVGVLLVHLLPLGADGGLLLIDDLVPALGSGEAVPTLAAVPALLVLAAAVVAAFSLGPSHRYDSPGGTAALAAFHLAAATAAFGHLLPFAATLGEVDASWALLTMPLRLGMLFYAFLLWIGWGPGTLAGALEALARRQKQAGYRTMALQGLAPGQVPPGARLPAAGLAPAAASAVPVAPLAAAAPARLQVPPTGSIPAPAGPAPLPLDLPADGPLPPPPGFRPASVPPPAARSAEPVVEIAAQHALPLLDTVAAPVRASSPLETPAVGVAPALPSAPAAAAPAPGPKAIKRTQLGMPAVVPPAGGSAPSGEIVSGRTGDTSLGLPSAKAPPPGAPPSRTPSERLWPPPQGFGRRPEPPGVPPPSPTASTFRPGSARDLPVPAAVRYAAPAAPAGEPSEAVRNRVSHLQRQLAGGSISPDEYQRRLEEILRAGK